MKKYILIFSFLFSYWQLFAQQETYTRIFSGSSYDEGIAVFRLPNKEIRLIGNTGSFGNGNTDVWYIALDSNGSFLWQKFYGGSRIEKVEDAVMNAQGDIFMVGSTTQNTAASYQVYFLGLDQYGQIIGYNNYGGTNWELGHGIDLINDTTLVLVGETYSKGAGQNDVYLLKVNNKGDTLWTKTFGLNQSDIGNAVKVMPDAGFIIAGTTNSFGNGSKDSYMIRTDQLGDTIWTKVVRHITDAEYMDVVVNPDTSLVFCGYLKDTLDTYRDINLEKFNKNASIEWSRFLSLSEGKECYAKSLIREPDERYTFCGITTKYGHSSKADARVLRTTPAGYWQESNSLGDIEQDIGNAITLDSLHGKHYLLVGTTKSYGISNSGIFFVRLDSNLRGDTTRNIFLPTNMLLSQDNEPFECYPNPVNEMLNIVLPKSEINFKVSVYNMLGVEVFGKMYYASAKTIAISTQSLAKGNYVLSIVGSNQTYKKLFIKL